MLVQDSGDEHLPLFGWEDVEQGLQSRLAGGVFGRIGAIVGWVGLRRVQRPGRRASRQVAALIADQVGRDPVNPAAHECLVGRATDAAE